MGLESKFKGIKQKLKIAALAVPFIISTVACSGNHYRDNNYRTIHPADTGTQIETNSDGSKIRITRGCGFLRDGEVFYAEGPSLRSLWDLKSCKYTLVKHIDIRAGPLKDEVNDNSTIAGRARLRNKEIEMRDILDQYHEGIENYEGR